MKHKKDQSIIHFISNINYSNHKMFLKVSLVKNQKMLFLVDINDSGNPIEMSFTESYGTIVSYSWLVLSFTHPSIHSFSHPFIHSFNHLYMHPFISSLSIL